EIDILEKDITKENDPEKLKNRLRQWLNDHMKTVLEPLIMLGIEAGQGKDDPVSEIVRKVYDSCGILPRSELEEEIAKLDNEMRVSLRGKKIRLGPLLVFMPDLNKPAAVRLKALLWSIFNDRTLPAQVPADGIVSKRLEQENPDKDYYQVIGYPVYGGRIVRIDMLDRVVNCIYDHAEKGRFKARHEMAEWLGSTIEDLYKVLVDLGHKKIYDPADELKAEEVKENKPQEIKLEEKPEDKKTEQVKPELATFSLKRGKAYEKAGRAKKEFKKGYERPDKGKNANKNKKGRGKQDKKKEKDHRPRVISFEAERKDEDSPFAILQNLEIKNKK
ncbi:MAG: helicase, partial [Alphaproteobacteria bacterium]|nr:helicase [Alphaproteobacteria bacterium]